MSAGTTAAEALTRTEALELEVELLNARITAIFDLIRDANRAAGLPVEDPDARVSYQAAASVQARRRQQIRLAGTGAGQ